MEEVLLRCAIVLFPAVTKAPRRNPPQSKPGSNKRGGRSRASEASGTIFLGSFESFRRRIAVDGTVILLHPPLPLAGLSIVMERERQQSDGLADG